MEHPLKLNQLLNLTEEEIQNTKIRFCLPSGRADFTPFEDYLRDPDTINKQAFLWRSTTRFFREGQLAISLLRLSADTYLLTTIVTIDRDLDVVHGINYEATEVERYKPLFGRVVIKFKKTFQSTGIYASRILDELEVVQILPVLFDGQDFPGYDKVRLTYGKLKIILDRNKRDWISALENQKGVYLITDLNNGRHYVGSAYGENGMLLSRWRSYVETGHGGNIELRELVDTLGFEYIQQNFQYSILENYNGRTDKAIILGREKWWKDVLGSRKFGYNSN